MELNELKKLLGISIEDKTKDTQLTFIISDVKETINNYCNTVEVHKGLLNTSYRMAVDLYRNENLGHEESALGSVSSISTGDTSTSFKQSVDDNFKDSLLKNYKPQLNRYRKLVW
ncbi:phage head-tail connector protein [Anaerosporobacter sp.]